MGRLKTDQERVMKKMKRREEAHKAEQTDEPTNKRENSVKRAVMRFSQKRG